MKEYIPVVRLFLNRRSLTRPCVTYVEAICLRGLISESFLNGVNISMETRVDLYKKDESGALPIIVAKEQGRKAVLRLLMQAKQEESCW